MWNRYRWEMKIKRKIKLIRTMSHRDKALAGWFVLMVIYMALTYLKGAGLWP
jgi:hypothetical protein